MAGGGEALPLAFPGLTGWLAARLERGVPWHGARFGDGLRESREAPPREGVSQGWTASPAWAYPAVGALRLMVQTGPGALR